VITGKDVISNEARKNKFRFCSFFVKIYSDDEEVATFFPVHKKMKKSRVGRRQQQQQQQQHQQLKDVDTFSIQEMTIIESESDGNDGDNSSDDDCDSQLNLELPQRAGDWSLMDKVREMFCCLQTRQRVF
jgi:hypothetical protein